MPKKKQAQAGATGVEGVKKEIFNLFAKKDASAFNQCIDLINESKIDASLKKDFMEYIVQIIRDELKQSREKQDFTTVTITLYFLKELKLDQSIKNKIINEFRILHNDLSAKEDKLSAQSQQTNNAQAPVGKKSTPKVDTKNSVKNSTQKGQIQKGGDPKKSIVKAGKGQSAVRTQVDGKTNARQGEAPAENFSKTQTRTPAKSNETKTKKKTNNNEAGKQIVKQKPAEEKTTDKQTKTPTEIIEQTPADKKNTTKGQKSAGKKSVTKAQKPAQKQTIPQKPTDEKNKQNVALEEDTINPIIKNKMINTKPKPKQLTQAEIDAKVKELFTRGTLDSITNFLFEHGEKVSDEQKLKLVNILSARTNSDGLYLTARDIGKMHFISNETEQKALDKLSKAMLKKNSADDVGLMYSYIKGIKNAPVDDLIEKMAKICGSLEKLKERLQRDYGVNFDSNIARMIEEKIAESNNKPE